MKKLLFLFVSLSVWAQPFPPASTTYTRDLLIATNAADARNKLGISSTNIASVLGFNTNQFTTNNANIELTTVTNRTLPNWINVKDPPYNAKGDGTNDDTVAIQTAFNAVTNTPIYFPPGTYNITSTLAISNRYGLNIIGSGARVTKLNVTGAIAGPALKIFNCQLFSISDLSVFANKLANVGVLIDSDNILPTSNFTLKRMEINSAINDGVRFGLSLVNNYQIDHGLLINCNLSGSKTNFTVESGNALENNVLDCQFFASTTNVPQYNIVILGGGVIVHHASFFNAVQYDVQVGTGASFNLDDADSESDKILDVAFLSTSDRPITLNNWRHNVDFAGTVAQWNRAGQLTVQNCRIGGDFYIGYLTNGVSINNTFPTGRGFIGSADAIQRMTILGGDTNLFGFGTVSPKFKIDIGTTARIQGANKLTFGGTGYTDNDVDLFRSSAGTLKTSTNFVAGNNVSANSGTFGANGNLTLYDNTSQGIVQINGKELTFYDAAVANSRLIIRTNGTLDLLGGNVSDTAAPPLRIHNNKIVTFLDAVDGLTLAGGLWMKTDNTLNIFNGNSSLKGISIDTNGEVSLPAGNLTLLNNKFVQAKDTSGTAENVIGIDSANNAQLNSPSSGGGIIHNVRKGDQHFKVEFSTNTVALDVSSNLFAITAPFTTSKGAIITGGTTNVGDGTQPGGIRLVETNGVNSILIQGRNQLNASITNNWPGTNAPGYLTNDGAGGLAWVTGSSGSGTITNAITNVTSSAGFTITRTGGAGVTNADVGLTTDTPQFARLGLGNAADANNSLQIGLGTITTDKHALDITGTWNASATNFTATKVNITDTASAFGSLLTDWQIGSVSKASIRKDGQFIGASVNVPTVFASTSVILGVSADTTITRDSANVLQLGADAASVVTPQTWKAADGLGTDKAGADSQIEGGQSTGTGRAGAVILRTGETLTTSSSANAYITRFYLSAKPVDLTGGTATLVFNVSLASGKTAGIHVFATTRVDDGTDFQGATDDFTAVAVNKGGTVSIGSISTSLGSTVATSGTISTVWTAVANGNGVDLKLNETTTVITPTTRRVRWRVEIDSNDTALTITPQ